MSKLISQNPQKYTGCNNFVHCKVLFVSTKFLEDNIDVYNDYIDIFNLDDLSPIVYDKVKYEKLASLN